MKSKGIAILTIAACAVAGEAAAQCRLEFNARTAVWTRTGPAPCPSIAVDVDINGVPTLYLDKSQTLDLVITDINPLMYVASIGEVTLEDIPQVKDLAALFLQFGGLITQLRAEGDVAPTLKSALLAVQRLMTAFGREEALLLSQVQQLEFSPSVSIAPPTARLAAWTSALQTLRVQFDQARSDHLVARARNAAERDANKDAMEKAEAILDKERDILKAVAAAKIFATRACMAAAGSSACNGDDPGGPYTVSRVLRLGQVQRDRWSKIATFPIAIKRQSPYDASLVSSLPDAIASKFRLTSTQSALLGIGVGVVTTNVVSPTWSAAADPANPAQKVVTRTGENDRIAIKSLVASYAFTGRTASMPVRPLLEFGTSLETKAPGAFVGIGFAVAKYLRLGIGVTGQRINALNGQTEGVTVVAEDAAIKTKNRWKAGIYWSFGLSLTDLPLFSRE